MKRDRVLRFLVDESATILVTHFLRSQGHDVVAVSEVAPSIPDVDVLTLAEAQDRILVTADKDFGQLVFQERRRHVGVLLLRPEHDAPVVKVTIVARVLTDHGHLLEGGFVVATERSVRLRSRR